MILECSESNCLICTNDVCELCEWDNTNQFYIHENHTCMSEC